MVQSEFAPNNNPGAGPAGHADIRRSGRPPKDFVFLQVCKTDAPGPTDFPTRCISRLPSLPPPAQTLDEEKQLELAGLIRTAKMLRAKIRKYLFQQLPVRTSPILMATPGRTWSAARAA